MYGCIFEISLVYHALSVFSYIDQWTCVWTASLLRLLQLKRCFILFDMAYSFYTPYKTYQNQIFEWRFNFVLYLASPSGVAKNVTLKKYCHLDIDLSIREIHRPYEFYIEALCILIFNGIWPCEKYVQNVLHAKNTIVKSTRSFRYKNLP